MLGQSSTTVADATSRVTARAWSLGAAACLAAAVAAVAWWNGFYGAEARAGLGLVCWWCVAILVGTALIRLPAVSRLGGAALACFGLFAVWTGISAAWSASAEDVQDELIRTLAYLGVFLLGALAGRRSLLRAWLVGLAGGIVAVGAISFTSRVAPSAFPDRGTGTFLADSVGRLSFPVGYWNGLAILLALAVPMLVAIALQTGPVWLRALAVGAVPLLAVDIYLASSRGGIVVAIVGAMVVTGLATDRMRALTLSVAAAVGAALAVLLVSREHVFVDGPLGTHAAAVQGHRATLWLIAVSAATAAATVPLLRLRLPRPSARASAILLAGALGAIVAAVIAAHPVRLFHEFQQPPGAVSYRPGSFAADHLASGAGNGRWQFWTSAIDEWQAHPIHGGGAGSFADWWTAHGPIAYVIRDAHSLYLQVLGELGLVGAGLLVASIGLGLAAGLRRVRGLEGAERNAAAAFVAVSIGWAVGAGIDWMWQLPVVTVVGLFALGVATHDDRARVTPRPRVLARHLPVVALAAAVVVAEGTALAAAAKISDSHAAAAAGDLSRARSDARSARRLEPWASTPYVQLALLSEQEGDLADAAAYLKQAIDRDERNWTLYVIDARLRVKRGDIAGAGRALAEARRLNPRSPLLASER